MKKLIWLWKGGACGFIIFIITHVASILNFIYGVRGTLYLTLLSGILVFAFTSTNKLEVFFKSTLCMYATLLVATVFFNNAGIENYFYYLRDGYHTRSSLRGLNFAFTFMVSLFASICGTVVSGIITFKRSQKINDQ